MTELKVLTIPALLESSIERFGKNNALASIGSDKITYNELSVRIQDGIKFLNAYGLKKDDKVAILSINMPNWAIVYFAMGTMGIVTVPLLPDFSLDELETILHHSGAKMLFVSDNLEYKLDKIKVQGIEHIISIEDFVLLKGKAPESESTLYDLPDIMEDDLASIIYTSGTTGKSKGVMLSHKNLVFDAIASGKVQKITGDDRFLSILPLSHAYENTIGLIVPMLFGACVYYLSKPPTPAVLMPALKEIKPTFMLTVPMIIERIYKKSILTKINKKGLTRTLYKIPFFRKRLNALAGKKLMKNFGGEIKFFGIGGAKLDLSVEKFLREAKFPYAIGYGLTETGPLLAGANPQVVRLQSTGPFIEGLEYTLGDKNEETGEGEIWVKGPNVMKGYYKEPELTSEIFTEDGWLKTGDLAMLDKDNFVYIKGRKKNTIVGANGENIYPEDIEQVINNFNHVVESLVMEQKGKLVAMVHFNREEIENRYQHLKEELTHFVEHKMNELKDELHLYVNERVNKFSRLQLIIVQHEPFHKTATHKIKRYLYL